MLKKILAFSLVSLILLNTAILKEAYAKADPYRDLEKWLLDNMNILGLFMHRGPEYSRIGNYLEPIISFSISDYNNKTSIYFPKTVSMKFSDYFNYVQNNKLILQMNVTYSGYKKTGPITAVWPPFSYIYNRPFNDTSMLGWGTYLTSNLPSYSMKSNEAEPYTINFFKWDVRNIFHENPQYLYEFLVLGNGSNVKLPKGENILLALSPYELDTSVYELIKSTLKNSPLPYPNPPTKILNEFAEDDTSAGLLYVTWEVEGNSGYLKPATILNYIHPIVGNVTLTHYADGLMRLQNESEGQWYKRTVQYDMERINKVNFRVSYDIVKTPIFATFGSSTKSYTAIIDLSNKDATNLLKSTSVYYIIDPNVYNGKDKIKLKISDAKGKINLIYEINIEVDKERFNIKDINVINAVIKPDKFWINYDLVDGQSSTVTTIRSDKSYNEDGSLFLKLDYKISEHAYAYESGEIPPPDREAYQGFYSSSDQEMGTINIYSKKNIQGAYLAFLFAVLADSIVKILWNYMFYFLIIYSNVATEIFAIMGTQLQTFLPIITAIFVGSKTAKNVGMKMNFQKALQLSDEDAKSLRSLSDKIRSSDLRLNDMILTFYYDSKFFSDLMGYLRDANLLLMRSYYRITNATEQLKMQELRMAYDYEVADLALLFFAIVNAPSSRSLALETGYLSSKFNTIAEILNNASLLLNNATMNGHTVDKLGPIVVLTPSDVFTNFYPKTNDIYVVISNIGDEDANVKLKILETNATSEFSSEVVNLKARSTEVITLKPMKKASNSESVSATLLAYVNDELIYNLIIDIPLTIGPYSASGNGIEVYSDGPVSINDKGISITNSTIVQILLPRSDSRYVVLLDGYMRRSAEIYGDNYTILAVAFSKPVSGIITYKSIKQDVEYLEGTGSVKGKTGVTIESSGAFKAQVSLLHDNPYPEASLEGTNKYKIISIDLLSAEAGSVTVKISFEDLGISDPSQIRLYKYNATLEAYQEVKNYQIDTNEKVVIFTIKPGDPVFALTSGSITGADGQKQSGWQFSINLFDIKTILIILVIAMLAVIAVFEVRRVIRQKHKNQ